MERRKALSFSSRDSGQDGTRKLESLLINLCTTGSLQSFPGALIIFLKSECSEFLTFYMARDGIWWALCFHGVFFPYLSRQGTEEANLLWGLVSLYFKVQQAWIGQGHTQALLHSLTFAKLPILDDFDFPIFLCLNVLWDIISKNLCKLYFFLSILFLFLPFPLLLLSSKIIHVLILYLCPVTHFFRAKIIEYLKSGIS